MVKIPLPPSPYESGRELELRYTRHGDLGLGVSTDGQPAEHSRGFIFSHGSEDMLMAAVIRFANIANESALANRVLREINESIRADLSSYYLNLHQRSSYHPLIVATGEWGRRIYDNQVMGWSAILDPIISQPDSIENVGGTGIYTREDIFGHHSLLLASIPSEFGLSLQESPRHFTLEFYKEDIEPLLRTIGGIAMGDYQLDVYWLIEEYLSAAQETDLASQPIIPENIA